MSGGVVTVYEFKDLPTYNKPGLPNTRYDIIRHGVLYQQRWTDAWGGPIRDRDHGHDHGKGNPHDHVWSGSYRGKGVIFSPEFL